MIKTLVIFIGIIFIHIQTIAIELHQVEDWLYILELESISLNQIASTDFDVIVMDYSKTGDESGEYQPEDIIQLQNSNKVVFAYMSIGEAEDYRFYWNDEWQNNPPEWLGEENPDWEGNYKVRFWMDEWKSILLGNRSDENKSYVDRIIDQGFDGVYLDIIDAYEYWYDTAQELTRLQARQLMIELVEQIRTYAIAQRGLDYFYIIPQNGSTILVDDDGVLDDLGRKYLQICDGIAAEDTWYDSTEIQSEYHTDEVLPLMKLFKSDSRSNIVLSVDYIWDKNNSNTLENADRFNDFYRKSIELNFIPYAAISDRDLDEIVTQKHISPFDFSQPLSVPVILSPWILY
jgi:cysteinyl-tRNA synthetase